jgi:hypothetical protein
MTQHRVGDPDGQATPLGSLLAIEVVVWLTAAWPRLSPVGAARPPATVARRNRR